MTKVHRITILVIDNDDLGADGVRDVIENARYPNHCIAPSVLGCETREVEWSDDHPLNLNGWEEAAAELFAPAPTPGRLSPRALAAIRERAKQPDSAAGMYADLCALLDHVAAGG